MRSHAHLNTAVSIIRSYNGNMPLGAWLKQYFREQKKSGSTDRKQIGHLCYSYYRLGQAFARYSLEEKILAGVFLCSSRPNKLLEELKPAWEEMVTAPPAEKWSLLATPEEATQIFPFAGALSGEIDGPAFSRSFLVQPDLFLRIRPGRKEKLCEQLKAAGIDATLIPPDCLALPNQVKVDGAIELDHDAVVQDLNSQQVVQAVKALLAPHLPLRIWDCCAASGGKSILFHDHFPKSKITVSDIRESILINLRNRFRRAGIHHYRQFLADLSAPGYVQPEKFDLVVCDAPCSGSGTWARTPEQLCFFKKEQIGYYAGLQKKIAGKAAQSVRPGGLFLYITCSVFHEENEEVVRFLQESLQLRSMQYFRGYQQKADTLFAAVFSAL